MSVAAVILSDLHLGAPHSVLNLRQWEPSELDGVVHGEAAREALCDALAAATAGERVERLILLGDVVDLSHGTFAHGVEEQLAARAGPRRGGGLGARVRAGEP